MVKFYDSNEFFADPEYDYTVSAEKKRNLNKNYHLFICEKKEHN